MRGREFLSTASLQTVPSAVGRHLPESTTHSIILVLIRTGSGEIAVVLLGH